MSVNEVAGLLEAGSVKQILEDKCKAQTIAIDGSCELPMLPIDINRTLDLTMK